MTIIKTIITISFFTISTFAHSQNEYTSNSSNLPEGKTTINADPNIQSLLNTKLAEENNSNYKIQLYYGSLNKAHAVLSKFNSKHSEWPGKIEYETPNYKVWVGNYQTRIEADKAMIQISKNFPSAFIFKP